MKTRLTWLLILMLALTMFWGCSDDDDPVTPDPTKTAFEVMAAAGAAYINDTTPDCPGTLAAATLEANLDMYTVIDIRGEADYLAGHIPGAVHSALGTLVADLADGTIPAGKTYVVACYSGQGAGHAKIAMELLGYTDVKTLLFGMSAWNTDFTYFVDGVEKAMDKWSGNCKDELGNPETTNNNADLTDQTFPVLSESASTVVADRVGAMLTAGFQGKSYDDIKDYLDSYFIINYFGVDDYEGNGTAGVPGHIPGAFQFTPYASLGIDQMLDQLPTDKPIIVYCWTGQHSSQITAYLNMLDYEAYSLTNGSNYLFHSLLGAHDWAEDQHNAFALEMGYAPTEAFETIANSMLEYINDSSATGCIGAITASTLNDNLSIYQVIDFRSLVDFDLGHIEGAIHSELTTLRADITDGTIPDSKPFVVTCYTGQTAGHAKIALEMMGYNDCSTLLWGMSTWNTSLTDSPYWPTAIGNTLGTVETDNNNADLEWYSYPTLDGATMDERVDAMLAGGFQIKSYESIEDYLGSYFIVNYFGVDDYEGNGGVPGHIPGAFQFTPYQSMGIDEMLGNIPNDMPVIVYCWSGQHSSQITAYLNMLGYEAYSLKSGSNNLFYDGMTGHKWVDTTNNFTLVATPALVAGY